jgi:integrase
MSVYKPHPGSPYWCDFELPDPFGRVKVSTAVYNKTDARSRESLLRELYRSGQHETLRAVINGDIDLPRVVAAKREKRLDNDSLFADLKLRGPLWSTLRSLFPAPGTGQNDQMARYHWSVKKLESLDVAALGTRAKVRDLAKVDWAEVLDAWDESEAGYNHVRERVSHALTRLLGDALHPARRAIMKDFPRANDAPSRKSKLSVPRFLEIIAKVDEDKRAPYWCLLITGLRTGEYLRCEEAHKRADLHIVELPIPRGRRTKAGQASVKSVAVDPSLWHWVDEAIPAPRKYRWLRIHWARAVRDAKLEDIRLHDIRHLTANAGLAGGASLADVQTLMRHADPRMTMHYAEMETSRRAARGLAKVLPMPVRKRGKRSRSA